MRLASRFARTFASSTKSIPPMERVSDLVKYMESMNQHNVQTELTYLRDRKKQLTPLQLQQFVEKSKNIQIANLSDKEKSQLHKELHETFGKVASRSILSSREREYIQDLNEEAKIEEEHLNNYLSQIKEDLYKELELNFAVPENGRTVILNAERESLSANLAEVITVAGLGNLCIGLAGMISYPSLILNAGLIGIGGLVSYARFLRRKSPRISQILLSNQGKLVVRYFQGTGGIFLNTSQISQVVLDKKDFAYNICFKGELEGFIYHYDRAVWCNVNGQLMWFFDKSGSTQFNSQLYHHLL